MLVVPNTEQIFVPCQNDDLLVSLTDSYDLILNLLDNFNNYFVNSQQTKTSDSCFVAAIQAANSIIKAVGGKVMLF